MWWWFICLARWDGCGFRLRVLENSFPPLLGLKLSEDRWFERAFTCSAVSGVTVMAEGRPGELAAATWSGEHLSLVTGKTERGWGPKDENVFMGQGFGTGKEPQRPAGKNVPGTARGDCLQEKRPSEGQEESMVRGRKRKLPFGRPCEEPVLG